MFTERNVLNGLLIMKTSHTNRKLVRKCTTLAISIDNNKSIFN